MKLAARWYGVNKDPFKEYIKESEPAKRDKGYAWHTAIGLQAVDGLKTSEYLVHTAVWNIEGEISFEEANYSQAGRIRDYNITKKEWVNFCQWPQKFDINRE